jgi:hypothetical protein
MAEKIHYIPNTKYVDGPSEVGGVIPVDYFVVFAAVMLFCMVSNLVTYSPFAGGLAAYVYHRFKRRYSKNFYLTIPYHSGLRNVDGVPPVTERIFRE